MYSSAIIVAAGKGTRMNSERNKVFMELGGIPLLARTIGVFERCSLIDEIVLVANETDMSCCENEIVRRFGFKKVKSIVAGGSERQYSVYNGLRGVSPDTEMALIHDAARPFVQEMEISDSIKAANEYGAAAVGVPVKDTVKVCDREGIVLDTPDRSALWAIQTPQVFRLDLILRAHEKALEDGFLGTDDAVLVERMGGRMKLVKGSYTNIKITTPEDIVIGEAIAGWLKCRNEDGQDSRP